MPDSTFRSDMSKNEFAMMLESRFCYLQSADRKTVLEIESSLGVFPTRGHPINAAALALFRQADTEHQKGASLEKAIERAMELFPTVKPRRRRTKKIDGHTDPDHDKFILLAEYKRYRASVDAGLNPAVAYSTNNFFEFILTRQWPKAAAVFAKANKEQRTRYCLRLNQIEKHE